MAWTDLIRAAAVRSGGGGGGRRGPTKRAAGRAPLPSAATWGHGHPRAAGSACGRVRARVSSVRLGRGAALAERVWTPAGAPAASK